MTYVLPEIRGTGQIKLKWARDIKDTVGKNTRDKKKKKDKRPKVFSLGTERAVCYKKK